MNDAPHDRGAPRSILLASDLGSRCDRALERSILLARHWQARLVVATVVERGQTAARQIRNQDAPSWFRPESALRLAGRQLVRDMAESGIAWVSRVEEGDAGEWLVRIAADERCDLVITGPAGHNRTSPAILGSTVDRLLRNGTAPLLMVRERLRKPYSHVLIASDFSDSSRAALDTAIAFFPSASFTLVHGFDVPMLGLMEATRDSAIEQYRRQAYVDSRRFLGECGLAADRIDAIDLVIEHGDPARLLNQYAESQPVDLVVLGTHGRGAVYETLVGSVAKRILASTQKDTLIVRGVPAQKKQ